MAGSMETFEVEKFESEKSNSEQSNELFPGFKDESSYSQFLLRAILQATKASNGLPTAGDQYDFYQSFKSFRKIMNEEGRRIIALMGRLIQQQGGGHFGGKDLEDLQDQLTSINDGVLERANNDLDEAAGIKKRQDEVVLSTVKTTKFITTSWNRKFKENKPSEVAYKLLAAKNIVRPQMKFQDLIDNSNKAFIPIIKEKPNSIKPLAILVESLADEEEEFSHPYEIEIEKFSPRDEHLQLVTALEPLPIQNTELIFVDTVEALQTLCDELKKQKEFAVDLEHHSYRSFQGITCLMQISTRDKDYIVDTLELRRDLFILNEIFTDPKIVKVFHGADMDILWLQRDFGLYVVNMFDTGQAARMLNFAHLSLHFIMNHYCQINMNKQFQLADWRIRPLPSEMLKYAREDTHYLLFVYDKMKIDLISRSNEQNNLLRAVFENSKLVCLKRYKKPIFQETSYLELYRKRKKNFNARQLFALQHLYAWRDKTARTEDESTGYVLPNHMLLQIAEVLPREQQGILACCNPIPPLVKHQLNELHSVIIKARERPLNKLEIPEPPVPIHSTPNVGYGDASNCRKHRHDFPSNFAENVQLPTLLDFKKRPVLSTATKQLMKRKSDVSIFDSGKEGTDSEDRAKEIHSLLNEFISPYERYKASKAKQSETEEIDGAATNTATPGLTDEERVKRIQEFYKELVSSTEQQETQPDDDRPAVEWDDTVPKSFRRRGKRANKFLTRPPGKKRRRGGGAPNFAGDPQPSSSFQPFDYSSHTDQSFFTKSQRNVQHFTPNYSQRSRGGKQRGRRNKRKQTTYKSGAQGPHSQKWPRS